MRTPKICLLGIIQNGFTMRWQAMGDVEGIGWLDAWGATMVEAMEALQTHAAAMLAKNVHEETRS